jgi:hypothetical protein
MARRFAYFRSQNHLSVPTLNAIVPASALACLASVQPPAGIGSRGWSWVGGGTGTVARWERDSVESCWAGECLTANKKR